MCSVAQMEVLFEKMPSATDICMHAPTQEEQTKQHRETHFEVTQNAFTKTTRTPKSCLGVHMWV